MTVIIRTEVTNKISETQTFNTKDEAEQFISDYNRFNQDKTWNRRIAELQE